MVAKHTLKNAAIPIVTITGLQFGTLLGGAVVTETVFAWPGIGRLAVQSIYNRDYPVVQCTVFLAALMFVVINFCRRPDLWRPRSPHPRRLTRSSPRRGGPGPRAPAPVPRAGGGGRRLRRRAAGGGGRRAVARAPGSRSASRLRGRLAAPTLEGADGRAHLLGTDHLGPRRALARDLRLARLAGGRLRRRCSWAGCSARRSGSLAGFRGGRVDAIIMTVADAQLAFPFILLAIGIIAVLGPSFPTLVVVIGLSGWVSYARILRSQVLVLRSREFVEAIHALGGSRRPRRAPPRAAQRALLARGHRHPRAGARHRARGHAVLPGPGHPAADAVLGRHGAGGPRVPRLGLVDLDLPRASCS